MELLMEMSEVNKEITRLERQIYELQVDLACEKEVTKGLNSRNTPEGKKRCKMSKAIAKFGNVQSMGSEKVKIKLGEFENENYREMTIPLLELGMNLKYN